MQTDSKTQTARPVRCIQLVRLLRVLSAKVKCHWYLLWKGMWLGECMFEAWHKNDGRLCFIAATTGSVWDNSLKVTRVFWNDTAKANARTRRS